LGAAVALEAVRIYAEPEFVQTVSAFSTKLAQAWETVISAGGLTRSRSLGGMAAADLDLPRSLQGQRVGFQVFQEALQRGAWLRNLGNTVYWLPPLNSPHQVVDQLAEITLDSIRAVRGRLGF
jgi:adenosylmethionine-8-amino-7-oxononanoate aminotransferase